MVPTAEELQRRRIVGVERERITNVTSTDFPGHYPGEDHAWDLQRFKDSLQIKIHRNRPKDLEFDLISVDASIANAFRRILISEIPTLAIETVYVQNNTSIVQDEVLAQRLGLVPLIGSKMGMQELRWFNKPEDGLGEASEPTDYNTIVLSLKVACEINKDAPKTATDPHERYHNSSVYAKDIVFEPAGRQGSWFGDEPIKAGSPNILLAKMRPGQEIDCQMHCLLGIGKDHAKFSPVATASYRLLPSIIIKKPILGADAEKFARCFPKGVVEVEKDANGEKTAVVKEPRKDTVSRECLRHDEFKGKVELGRIRDHFIFSIESTSMYDSDELFLQAVQILKQKCVNFRDKLVEV